MNEQKFDNGDWRVEKFDSGGIRLNCNGRCLAKLDWIGKALDADRIDTNFRLMSASPEGIGAAIEARAFILGLYREGIADALEITKVVDKLEAYIAKAIDIKDWSELEDFERTEKDCFVRLEIPPTEDDGSCSQICGLRYFDDCSVHCLKDWMLINEEYPENSNTKSDIPGPKCPRYIAEPVKTLDGVNQ